MKKTADKQEFEPGKIYEIRLVSQYDDTKTIYVGETTNMEKRLSQHKASVRNADAWDEDTTLLYQTLAAAEAADIEWHMVEVDSYGRRGPGDLEDVYVINALARGCVLANMRRGSDHWLETKQREADEMRANNYNDVRVWRQNRPSTIQLDEKVESEFANSTDSVFGDDVDDESTPMIKRKTRRGPPREVAQTKVVVPDAPQGGGTLAALARLEKRRDESEMKRLNMTRDEFMAYKTRRLLARLKQEL
jgi:hypothetical protein